MSLAGAWRSGRPTTALELVIVDDETVVRADSRNTRHLRAYAELDARLAREFDLGGGSSLTAFLELSNALNRRNECCTEFEIEDESEQPELILESIRSLPLVCSPRLAGVSLGIRRWFARAWSLCITYLRLALYPARQAIQGQLTCIARMDGERAYCS